MPWEDRIIAAVYVAPDGTRFTFDYEDVSQISEKNTVVFNFPDADGTYIQDLGRQGRRYPLRVFFWGDDYDIEASDFIDALEQRGIGKLEHPIYGIVDVVPFGVITRKDALKTGANQAVIDVVFFETNDAIYPTSQSNPASEVQSAVTAFNEASAQQFDDAASLDTAVEQSAFRGIYDRAKGVAVGVLEGIAAQDDAIKSVFDAVNTSINNVVTALVGDPLSLAFQTQILIQSPARTKALIDDRLDAYENLLDSIINQGIYVPGFDSTNSNTFHTADLYGMTYLTGSVISVVNNSFTTKPEAIDALTAF